jgi:hypothetical protein
MWRSSRKERKRDNSLKNRRRKNRRRRASLKNRRRKSRRRRNFYRNTMILLLEDCSDMLQIKNSYSSSVSLCVWPMD